MAGKFWLSKPYRGAAYTPPAGPSDLPEVGPAPFWNGAAKSGVGGATITWNARTTSNPQPIGRWHQPDELWFHEDMVIGVDAFAPVGIEYVEFFGDCATTRVTVETLRVDTDERGNPRKRLGYWITLKASLFQAVSTSGTARVFARVKAVGWDAVRIIGTPTNPGEVLELSAYCCSDYPQTFYVRSVEGDFTGSVGSTTGTYATLAAFFNAARTANAQRPVATCVDTAFYEMSNGNSGATGTGNAKGRALLKAAPGVTATFRREADFDSSIGPEGFQTAHDWRPGWPGVEARGRGIIFDVRNVLNFRSEKRWWFNGCRLTNSAGWPAMMYYWNGAPKERFGIKRDNTVGLSAYWSDCVIEYQSGGVVMGSPLISGNKRRYIYSVSMQFSTYVVNDRLEDTHAEIIGAENGYPLITGVPSGPGGGGGGTPQITLQGPANSTFSLTKGNGDGNGSLVLKVNGVQVGPTITLAYKTGLAGHAPVYCDELKDVIENSGDYPGWACTVLLNDWLGCRFLGSINIHGNTVQYTNEPCSSPVEIRSYIDDHNQYIMGDIQNGMYRNTIVIRGSFNTSYNFVGECTDAAFINLLGDGGGLYGLLNQSGGFANKSKNVTWWHCGVDGNDDCYSALTWDHDGNPGTSEVIKVPTSADFEQPLLQEASWKKAMLRPYNLNILDNALKWNTSGVVVGVSNDTQPAGVTVLRTDSDGDVNASYGQMFMDRANHDWRPNPSGALYANQTARRLKYDLFYNERSLLDVPGPISKNAPAMETFDWEDA